MDTRVLLDVVIKEKLMSLESAIQKITSFPAQKFHLSRRGLIKNGHFADLTLFSAAPSLGINIREVLVNGMLALSNGELGSKTSGMVLCRSEN